MRKFTLILSLMVVTVTTAMAQITDLNELSNDKNYVIMSQRCWLAYCSAQSETKLCTTNANNWAGDINIEDNNLYFNIIKDGESYYLFSVAAGKYVNGSGEFTTEKSNALSLKEVSGDYKWQLSINGNELNSQIPGQFSEGITVSNWDPADAGNSYKIFDVDVYKEMMKDAKENYNTAVNNAQQILNEAQFVITSTEKIDLQVDDSNTAGYLWANTYATGDEGIIKNLIDGDNNTYFHTSWSNYATDGTKDYLEVDLGENKATTFYFDYMTRHNASTDYPVSVTLLGSNDKNIYEEIHTISKELPIGNTKSYQSNVMGNGNNYRYIRFQVNSTSRGDATIPYFHLAEFNIYRADVTVAEGLDKYIPEIAALDAAVKSISIENCDAADYDLIVNSTNRINDAVTAYYDANREIALVYSYIYNDSEIYNEKVIGLIGDDYPEITIRNKFPLGVSATKPAGTVTSGADNIVKIPLIVDYNQIPFEFTAEGTPATWYYAQIHTNNKSYIKINENDKLYWKEGGQSNGALFTTIAAEDVDDYSWGFVGSVFGGFKMINKDGRGVKMSDDGTVTTVDASEATAFLAMPVSVDNAGAFGLYAQNANAFVNAQATIASWWDDDAGSAILLTERNDNEITVSELGYATLYLGEPVFIPETVEAYVVSSVDGKYAQMTQVTGTLPKNTGVILKNAGEHTFTTSVATATVGTNLLQGTLEAAEITKENGNSYYILANGEEGIGFYNPVLGDDATKFNNAANKAYLVVPGVSEVASYSFRFGEGTTGVEKVEIGNEKSEIYDLTGRRVEAITAPGIYVVNGKKLLVK